MAFINPYASTRSGIVVDKRDLERPDALYYEVKKPTREVPRHRSKTDHSAVYVGIPPKEQPVLDEAKTKTTRTGLEATTRQKVFLRAIKECSVSDRGPSFRQVQLHMGLKSVRAVQKAVIALKRKGLLEPETKDEGSMKLTIRGEVVLRIFLRSDASYAIDDDDLGG